MTSPLRLTRKERALLRRLFGALKKRYPIQATLHFRQLRDVQGYCIGSGMCGAKRQLVIDPRTTFSHAVDTLVHEYAHALTLWREDHHPVWGVMYAELLTTLTALGPEANA